MEPRKYKLSRFFGRDSRPEDDVAFKRIEEAFAPAAVKPSVWKSWTDWQFRRRKNKNDR